MAVCLIVKETKAIPSMQNSSSHPLLQENQEQTEISSSPSSSSEKKEEISSGGYCSLLRKKDVLVTVLLYGLEAICQVSYDSLISLWLSSNPEEGGMGWTAMDIGWFLCFVCPMQSGNCKHE